MPVLAKFTKQPADMQDYDIDYTDYLDGLQDSAESVDVVAEVGIKLFHYSLIGKTVKVWVDGGTHGETYKVSVTLKTAYGRTKQAEIAIKVKEI